MNEPIITFIFPLIRTDYIDRALETLFRYTSKVNFKIIIVDQSIEGLNKEIKDILFEREDMYIRIKNQGFSRAVNEGIIHALKWQTPYICVVNDDVEFMYSGWLEDALKEFEADKNIIAVCPESPRVAMWGYGHNNGEMLETIPYKEKFTDEDIAYLKKGDYDKEEIQSRHDYKISETFPFTKRGCIDGIAMWMPIFKREAFVELGLFDEKFVWGSGEDYEMLTRAYSCAWPIDRTECDSRYHRRMVSTMKSWVWHWWSRSIGEKKSLSPELFQHKQPWNNISEIFPPELNGGHNSDPWGHWTDEKGIRRPFRRIKEVHMQK